MGSSKSTLNLKTEIREKLYYNKYSYRAKFHCLGLHLLQYAGPNVNSVVQTLNSPRYKDYKPYKDKILDFHEFYFKNHHQTNNVMVRYDYNSAGVFSNNLELLQTLESIGCPVEYTLAIDSIPKGIKYFVKEPKHKYRLYFKSKRVSDGFAEKLKEWVERYENTSTVITPCSALKYWYTPKEAKTSIVSTMFPSVVHNTWRSSYTFENFFIDYNDESVLTLFRLMFDGIAGKQYTLLKKPD